MSNCEKWLNAEQKFMEDVDQVLTFYSEEGLRDFIASLVSELEDQDLQNPILSAMAEEDVEKWHGILLYTAYPRLDFGQRILSLHSIPLDVITEKNVQRALAVSDLIHSGGVIFDHDQLAFIRQLRQRLEPDHPDRVNVGFLLDDLSHAIFQDRDLQWAVVNYGAWKPSVDTVLELGYSLIGDADLHVPEEEL